MVVYSLFTIHNLVIGNTLHTNNKPFQNDTPQEKERNDLFSEFLNISQQSIEENFETSLRKKSPFTQYYEGVISKIRKSHCQNTSYLYTKNEFYCPKLFQLVEDQLYIVPLWSGIMIKDQKTGYEIKSRLSNNPVENWIGQLKHNILRNKNVSFYFLFF